MNNFCTKILGSLVANKAKAHFTPPKSLNLYFKGSVNPQFRFLNLQKISAISLDIVEAQDKPVFILNAKLDYSDSSSTTVELASFVSRADAENASEEIRVKLYGASNSLIKHMLTLTVLMLFISVSTDFVSKVKGALIQPGSGSQSVQVNGTVPAATPSLAMPQLEQQQAMQQQANVGPIGGTPPPASSQELQDTIDKLQQLKQMQDQVLQQNATGEYQTGPLAPAQQQPAQPLTPAEQLLQGLN